MAATFAELHADLFARGAFARVTRLRALVLAAIQDLPLGERTIIVTCIGVLSSFKTNELINYSIEFSSHLRTRLPARPLLVVTSTRGRRRFAAVAFRGHHLEQNSALRG